VYHYIGKPNRIILQKIQGFLMTTGQLWFSEFDRGGAIRESFPVLPHFGLPAAHLNNHLWYLYYPNCAGAAMEWPWCQAVQHHRMHLNGHQWVVVVHDKNWKKTRIQEYAKWVSSPETGLVWKKSISTPSSK
jgi:hypothetical protein